MSKKNFKVNPALQFISGSEGSTVQDDAADGTDVKTDPAAVDTDTPAEPQTIPTATKAPKGFKRNPLFVEVKSKRMQLIVQPSLFNRVKAASAKLNLSMNEFCHEALEQAALKAEGN